MRRSFAIVPFVLFLPFLSAHASYDRVELSGLKPVQPQGSGEAGIRQGPPRVTFEEQCGQPRELEGVYHAPDWAMRVSLSFSEDCDIYADAQRLPAGRHIDFTVRTLAGLRLYRLALRQPISHGHSRVVPFCQIGATTGEPLLPYDVVQWSDEEGPYHFVEGRAPGQVLREGEQTTYLMEDEFGPDCWMIICVRGRGDCRIPFP